MVEKNFIPVINEYFYYFDEKEEFKNNLDNFVNFIFSLDYYDIIIPVEGEGLNLFLSKYKKLNDQERENLYFDIVPSNSITFVNKNKYLPTESQDYEIFERKKILIFDATIRTGTSVQEIAEEIEKYIGEEICEISHTAFLYLDDYRKSLKPNSISKFVSFNFSYEVNHFKYKIIKESVLSYINENVFSQACDPPMWVFDEISEENIDKFQKAILKIPSAKKNSHINTF